MTGEENLKIGLTGEQVTESRKKHGSNKLDNTGSKNILHIIKDIITEPMMIQLIKIKYMKTKIRPRLAIIDSRKCTD